MLTDIRQKLSVLHVGLNLYKFSHPEVTCLAEISYLDFLSSGYGKGYLQKIIHVTCLSYLRTGCVGVLSLALPLAIQDAF